jgi:hypothetical protein
VCKIVLVFGLTPVHVSPYFIVFVRFVKSDTAKVVKSCDILKDKSDSVKSACCVMEFCLLRGAN